LRKKTEAETEADGASSSPPPATASEFRLRAGDGFVEDVDNLPGTDDSFSRGGNAEYTIIPAVVSPSVQIPSSARHVTRCYATCCYKC
jgi:hypothetical protein